MKKRIFSIEKALRFAWDMMRDNIGLFFKIFWVNVTLVALGFLINIFLGPLKSANANILRYTLAVLLQILEIIINLGFLGMFLNLHDQKKTNINQIFSNYKLFFKYFIAAILYTLIVLGGLILFVIPGIIWGIKFKYFRYLIIDQKLGPIQALKRSAEITQGAKLDLYIFGLITYVLQIIGLITFGFGLFFIIPIIWMADAFIYRKLESATK